MDNTLAEIVPVLHEHALNSDTIKPLWGWDLTRHKTMNMIEYNLDAGEADFGSKKSKNSGRVSKLSKKGHNQYLSIKTDINRVFSGLDYSISDPSKKKTKPKSVYDYVGLNVTSSDDSGEVVEIGKHKNNKMYAKIK